MQITIDTANPGDLEAAERVLKALRGETFAAPTPSTEPGTKAAPVAGPDKPKRTHVTKKPAPTAVEVDGVKVAETTHTDLTKPEPTEDETPMALAEPETEPTAENAVTLADLQALGKALLTGSPDGRERLQTILREYDAARLSDLAPEAFAQVAEKIAEASK